MRFEVRDEIRTANRGGLARYALQAQPSMQRITGSALGGERVQGALLFDLVVT